MPWYATGGTMAMPRHATKKPNTCLFARVLTHGQNFHVALGENHGINHMV